MDALGKKSRVRGKKIKRRKKKGGDREIYLYYSFQGPVTPGGEGEYEDGGEQHAAEEHQQSLLEEQSELDLWHIRAH